MGQIIFECDYSLTGSKSWRMPHLIRDGAEKVLEDILLSKVIRHEKTAGLRRRSLRLHKTRKGRTVFFRKNAGTKHSRKRDVLGVTSEDPGKETVGDVLCFVQGIAKSHDPGCQEGPEIAVHMIQVISLIIYCINVVGSIMYPIGYMKESECMKGRLFMCCDGSHHPVSGTDCTNRNFPFGTRISNRAPFP